MMTIRKVNLEDIASIICIKWTGDAACIDKLSVLLKNGESVPIEGVIDENRFATELQKIIPSIILTVTYEYERGWRGVRRN